VEKSGSYRGEIRKLDFLLWRNFIDTSTILF
jgi:hypothetical protein